MSGAASVPSSLVIRELFRSGGDFARYDWQFFREGVEIARLYGTANGASAALLRYAPGARVPRHLHRGFEHILVLSGSQSDEQGSYPAGTMIMHGEGTEHSIASPEGCVVLAIWEKPVQILGG